MKGVSNSQGQDWQAIDAQTGEPLNIHQMDFI